MKGTSGAPPPVRAAADGACRARMHAVIAAIAAIGGIGRGMDGRR
jgi:hypothetical protein